MITGSSPTPSPGSCRKTPAIQVVGIATTGPEAISLARLLLPSLVLMDIGLPGMDGVEATWTIRRQCPGEA